MAAPTKPATASIWRPLRLPAFRNLLLANVASDIGTFMQGVGAAWLMLSLNGGPMFVALTQTAAALPFFILALPAGAIGDIYDRRKVILFTEVWMVVAAIALAVVTLAGRMSPGLLLALTFILSAGDALEMPTWRAVLPELVGKDDLPAVAALNGIEFNIARAVGPAMAGLLIAVAGVGATFVVNVVSFFGVIAVVARWRRPAVVRTAPPETITGATVAALRYIRHSPPILVVLLRVGATLFCASGLLALLPSFAHRANHSAIGYGALLGVFGAGAVLSAFSMNFVRAHWSTNRIVSASTAVFGLATAAVGVLHGLMPLAAALLFCGASWIFFVSLFTVQVLNQVPDWVRARSLAVLMLVFQGSFAAGSATWGALAAHYGLNIALLLAGIGATLAAALGIFFRLSDASVDLTPWIHWRMPVVASDADRSGPVLVTVEYRVHPDRARQFVLAMRRYGRVRRRDGASRWGVSQDVEVADHYLETFVVSSWAEHVRQHGRAVIADRELETSLQDCLIAAPSVRHLLCL